MIKALNGTAIYTGGGFYSVIASLDNGQYLVGNNDYCVFVDADPRNTSEIDTRDYDLPIYSNEWIEKHDTHAERESVLATFEDFCKRLDAEEDGINEGYQKLNNYIAGEVCNYIDFSYFD